MYVHLETERLSLRPLNLEDSEFIVRLLNTEGWLSFIGDRNVRNPQDAKGYIEKILSNPKYFYNVIELKEAGHPIGIVTFLERDNQKYPDIGFALLPEYEKKGYAFEACERYLNELGTDAKLFYNYFINGALQKTLILLLKRTLFGFSTAFMR
jgi:RimJ/RimL family protein N-acetyltransferase